MNKTLKIIDVTPNYNYELYRFFPKRKDIEKGWEKFVKKVKFKTPFRKFFVVVDKATYKLLETSPDVESKLISMIIKFIDSKYAHLGFDYKSLSKKVRDSADLEYLDDMKNKLYFEIIDVPKYISNNYGSEQNDDNSRKD